MTTTLTLAGTERLVAAMMKMHYDTLVMHVTGLSKDVL